ncbi:MAG: acetolactate synthase-1/2/3 large subunit [Alphaproteobacteria bacterium]|jgi:acetolactate synthase-1/2/3 large subunit
MNFAVFPNIWGGFGIDVTESDKIAESLILARNFVKKENKSVVVNIWVDPNEYAPGTKSQTMYK